MFKLFTNLFKTDETLEEAQRLLEIFTTNRDYYSEYIFTPVYEKLVSINAGVLFSPMVDGNIVKLVEMANAEDRNLTLEQRISNLETYLNYKNDRKFIIRVLSMAKMSQILIAVNK